MAQRAIVSPQSSPVTRRIEFVRETATSIAVTAVCVLAALLAATAVMAAALAVLQVMLLIDGILGVVLAWSAGAVALGAAPTVVVRAVVRVLESLEALTERGQVN